jgi:hypothetical protein
MAMELPAAPHLFWAALGLAACLVSFVADAECVPVESVTWLELRILR